MDPFDLERFRRAQTGVFETARAELKAGAKRSHWMWFIFPQLRGLGSSAMAETYGIGSLAEAEAYLADPTLGPRLIELFEIALSHADKTPRALFGSPDDLKFRSCATLFSALPNAPPTFAMALDRFFGGAPDPRTLALLGRSG
jgi:uncharacterized protein (DUF1810 family)